jgi:hypothetical protein
MARHDVFQSPMTPNRRSAAVWQGLIRASKLNFDQNVATSPFINFK